MDKIIQIERLRYAKILGERTLSQDLINNCPEKSENLKPQVSLRPPLFSFQKWPSKLISKVAVLKYRKILLENPRWISVLVVGHRIYLQKHIMH